ncbi:phospholipase-like protein [Tanacetum coccineum]
MLRRQHKVDDQHHDMPLIYYMEGHNLHFGRREFSLITGFRFGTVSFDLHSSGELKFRNRVFPNKIGFSITNLDIIGVIEDEEIFGKVSDDDAIRLCLLLALEVIFMGRLLTFNVDDTLFSLVENIEAWNSFPWGEHLWCHLYDEIKNLKERHGDEHYYGLFKDRNYVPTYTLSGFVFAFQIWIIEKFERSESWWIKDPKVIPGALGWSKKSLFTRSYYPYLFSKESRAPPIKEHHGLFETYLSKLEKARKRGKTGFMVSSIGGTTNNIVLAPERSDRQAKLKFTNELSSMTFDLCDSLNSMFADLIEPADPDEDIAQDTSRVLQSMDTVWLSYDIERFLGKSGQIKGKFPWNDDYIVDRNFWLKLVCLDPVRKGWLTEEVFILINETGEHWCLAQFHIMSGEVTFYDTGNTYDYDYRDWNGYLRKGRKTKPNRQNRTRNGKAGKRQSQSPGPNVEKSTQVNPEAKSQEK